MHGQQDLVRRHHSPQWDRHWETPNPMRWASCPLVVPLDTHQEAPGQGAEPLKGVLRGVGAQPSLDGDLWGAGTMSCCPGRDGGTTRTRIQSYQPM